MIVKFHARGRGGGSGPVDYLLGKDRQRPGASVLQGRAEEVRELIDASPYAKKYTSGVLSFAEADLPPGERERLMQSFERILMPGLDKDQYSVLWVEHLDKGRLELNFLIPNTELLTGKRLQPYYDRADRPRVEAWQTIVNDRLGLHDPNAPENRRVLTPPSNLPQDKQEAVQAITAGLLQLCEAGEVKTRQDVTEALTTAGFEVVRTTRSSISIASPDGGQNIRLKGALYEQSFAAGEDLRAEIERAGQQYRDSAERRVQQAREICARGTERKRKDNQRRYRRPDHKPEYGGRELREDRPQHGYADVAVCPGDVLPGVWHRRERGVVHGASYPVECRRDPAAEPDAGCPGEKRGENPDDELRERRASVREGGQLSRGLRDEFRIHDSRGVLTNDGTGNPALERLRAVTAGLRATAARMGEQLRGIAEDVWYYATGERETERAGQRLESAGAELKRAAPAFNHAVVLWLDEREEKRLKEEKLQQEERLKKQMRHSPRP